MPLTNKRFRIFFKLFNLASVQDVDKAVSSGPGLRWAVMGPHMLFSLASGRLGMAGCGASWAALFLVAGHEVHVYDSSDGTQRFVTDDVRNTWPYLQALNPSFKEEPPQPNFGAMPQPPP